jgi:hypothetical protein
MALLPPQRRRATSTFQDMFAAGYQLQAAAFSMHLVEI